MSDQLVELGAKVVPNFLAERLSLQPELYIISNIAKLRYASNRSNF